MDVTTSRCHESRVNHVGQLAPTRDRCESPAERFRTMASASDYSSDSENETPILKKKKSTGAKADSDDFSFKNVLRPPRSTTYTAQALYGTSLSLPGSVLPLLSSTSNAII